MKVLYKNCFVLKKVVVKYLRKASDLGQQERTTYVKVNCPKSDGFVLYQAAGLFSDNSLMELVFPPGSIRGIVRKYSGKLVVGVV